jgi:hypothetical protein
MTEGLQPKNWGNQFAKRKIYRTTLRGWIFVREKSANFRHIEWAIAFGAAGGYSAACSEEARV